MNAVKTCQILMGRRLEEWEKEIFLFPRACRVCHTSRNKPNMIDCIACLCVTYCSEKCQEQDKNHHAKFCQELKYAMVSISFHGIMIVLSNQIFYYIDSNKITKIVFYRYVIITSQPSVSRHHRFLPT